jgi:hypothetical protein
MATKLVRSSRGTILPVAGGDRAFVRLAAAKRTNYVSLVARGQFDQSVGAATSIRNRGSIWAAFDEVVLDENGQDMHVYRGPVLRMISEALAPSALSATRVTSTAIQAATQLREHARMYFAMPFGLDPAETAFVERNPGQLFQVGVRLAATPATRLVNPGANTSALTNVSVTVLQGYDNPNPDGTLDAPLFIPMVRQLGLIPVAAASSAQVVDVRTTNLCRMIIISQETTTEGEVSDIINSFVFRGDNKTLIGPNVSRWDDLLLDNEYELGGAVLGNASHLPIMFQRYGRIGDSLNPSEDVNIRFEFNVQPSASAGASQLRITLVELVRSQVTAKTIPFSY